MLLDEPLSNLDAKLRERARVWLGQLKTQVKLTTIYVTHDQNEALALSDRIVVMNKGRAVQIGTPEEIYANPLEPFVADFIGTSSFFPGRIADVGSSGESKVVLEGGETIAIQNRFGLRAEQPVRISIRPENISIITDKRHAPASAGVAIPARIVNRSYLGARFEYELDAGGTVTKVETADFFDSPEVYVWLPSSGSMMFPDETSVKDGSL